MTNIVKIEGVGKVYAEKLVAAGIKTTEALLEAGFKAKTREEIAAKKASQLSSFWNRLTSRTSMRIKGVGEEYSDFWKKQALTPLQNLLIGSLRILSKKSWRRTKRRSLFGDLQF
jgi:Domain of unknown function (DUF4332)